MIPLPDLSQPWTNPPISLRDYFAGQVVGHLAMLKMPFHRERMPLTEVELIADQSYRIADAMLAERERAR